MDIINSHRLDVTHTRHIHVLITLLLLTLLTVPLVQAGDVCDGDGSGGAAGSTAAGSNAFACGNTNSAINSFSYTSADLMDPSAVAPGQEQNINKGDRR